MENISQQFLSRLNACFDGNVFLVGGYVRDSIMGFESKDIDVEIFGHDFDKICDIVKTLPYVKETFECGKSFSVIKVKLIDGSDIDISVPRREISTGTGHKDYKIVPDPSMSLYEASSRRDFTFNAIMKRVDGEIIDHHGGVSDIENKRLRAVGNSFLDDPLRVLRGMQFAGRFDMRIENDTAYLCAIISGQVLNMSKERIWGEWEKLLLKANNPSLGIRYLQDTGAIVLFPQLAALEGLEQDPKYHPEGDVLTHTKMVLNKGVWVSVIHNYSDDDRIILMLSCLCHDMGKIATTTRNEDGRIVSPAHAQEGGPYILAFMELIGTPKKYHEPVLTLCRHHMDLCNVKPTKRFVRRLANKVNVHSSLDMLISLIVCDHTGRGDGADQFPSFVFEFDNIARELGVEKEVPKPIMQGRDLIALGLKPGPQFKTILAEVYEQQLDGNIVHLDDAVQYVKETFEWEG